MIGLLFLRIVNRISREGSRRRNSRDGPSDYRILNDPYQLVLLLERKSEQDCRPLLESSSFFHAFIKFYQNSSAKTPLTA